MKERGENRIADVGEERRWKRRKRGGDGIENERKKRHENYRGRRRKMEGWIKRGGDEGDGAVPWGGCECWVSPPRSRYCKHWGDLPPRGDSPFTPRKKKKMQATGPVTYFLLTHDAFTRQYK